MPAAWAVTCELQAKQAVTCARNTNASLPQAPYESTARRVRPTGPSAVHLSSLAWCFLLRSVVSRTAPTISPASAKVKGFLAVRQQ